MPLSPTATRDLLAQLGHQPKRFLGIVDLRRRDPHLPEEGSRINARAGQVGHRKAGHDPTGAGRHCPMGRHG